MRYFLFILFISQFCVLNPVLSSEEGQNGRPEKKRKILSSDTIIFKLPKSVVSEIFFRLDHKSAGALACTSKHFNGIWQNLPCFKIPTLQGESRAKMNKLRFQIMREFKSEKLCRTSIEKHLARAILIEDLCPRKLISFDDTSIKSIWLGYIEKPESYAEKVFKLFLEHRSMHFFGFYLMYMGVQDSLHDGFLVDHYFESGRLIQSAFLMHIRAPSKDPYTFHIKKKLKINDLVLKARLYLWAGEYYTMQWNFAVAKKYDLRKYNILIANCFIKAASCSVMRKRQKLFLKCVENLFHIHRILDDQKHQNSIYQMLMKQFSGDQFPENYKRLREWYLEGGKEGLYRVDKNERGRILREIEEVQNQEWAAK
ncbi:MAG: F-box protein [Alphaproteobacteria bacterium]